jgi:hypothetical protein
VLSFSGLSWSSLVGFDLQYSGLSWSAYRKFYLQILPISPTFLDPLLLLLLLFCLMFQQKG